MSTIQDLMSRPVYTCKHDDLLNEAAQVMWERDCGAVAVVNHQGGLIGMVTDRDICMSAYTQKKLLSEIPVSVAMSTQVFSCRATDSIEAVERLMRECRIRRVPVLDTDNRPVGLLSLNDLARDAATRKRGDVEHAFVETMAAICERRQAA